MSERLLPASGQEWASKYGKHFQDIRPLRESQRIPYLQMVYDEQEKGKIIRHWGFEVEDEAWHVASRIHTLPPPTEEEKLPHEVIKAHLQHRQDMSQHFHGMRKNMTTHAACINLIWSNLDQVCDTFFPVPNVQRSPGQRNYAYVEVGMHLGYGHEAIYQTPDIVIERFDGALIVVEVGSRTPSDGEKHKKRKALCRYKKAVEQIGMGVPVYGFAGYYHHVEQTNTTQLTFIGMHK